MADIRTSLTLLKNARPQTLSVKIRSCLGVDEEELAIADVRRVMVRSQAGSEAKTARQI